MTPFFISTPIYYVNARPHLGHAYTTIVADSMNRFQQLQGNPTFFLTGTDEHGDKIVQAAEAGGLEPRAYTDTVSAQFKDLWPTLDICYTRFIRTTEKNHIHAVQDVLQKVYDKGDIYFDEYGGHYCFGCERFYTEKELIDGKCPDHQTVPTYIREKNYFFRMRKYLEPLREHILQHPEFIQPERYRNEVLSMLNEDLWDLCISRPKTRLTWGIELPFDRDFVTYVWFDALLNYISGLNYPESEHFSRFWPGAHHLVAKDILKPHAIFWPTMLMSAELPLYQSLLVHGYWTVNETKMSKSLGNVVAPLDMAKKYGLNAFRYFLLTEMSFGQDSSFSEEALVNRFNAELANDLGNLFSRTLSMAHKYCGGCVPKRGALTSLETDLVELGQNALRNFQTQFSHAQFSHALRSLWELVRGLNKYIDSAAPWTLYKEEETERLATVLAVLLEGMRKVAVHLWPVMPSAAEALLEQLGVHFALDAVNLDEEAHSWGSLPTGTPLAARSQLFPRQEYTPETQPEGKELPTVPEKSAASSEKAVQAESILFEDFTKVDMRVGTVRHVKAHPKADRLLILAVDVGEETPRQIVSGIAEHWTPEELEERQVVVVMNLAPRKLRGEISQGMILAVKDTQGLALLAPSRTVPAGAQVS